MSAPIVLTVRRAGTGYRVCADEQSWSWTRDLDITRMKAYLLAWRVHQRTGDLVRVIEDTEVAR